MYVYLHPTRITLLASFQKYNNKKKTQNNSTDADGKS